jgi:hypothetical protein
VHPITLVYGLFPSPHNVVERKNIHLLVSSPNNLGFISPLPHSSLSTAFYLERIQRLESGCDQKN